MTLWWAPVIGIAIGALILGTFVTQRKRGNKSSASNARKASTAQSTDDDDDLAEYEAKVLRSWMSRIDGRSWLMFPYFMLVVISLGMFAIVLQPLLEARRALHASAEEHAQRPSSTSVLPAGSAA
jgi:F0F1-type ATP synthase assembly protein I